MKPKTTKNLKMWAPIQCEAQIGNMLLIIYSGIFLFFFQSIFGSFKERIITTH